MRQFAFLRFALPVIALIAQPLAAQAPAQATQFRPAHITVTGTGRVTTAPDMATVSLGVTSRSATAADAMATMSTHLATVLENLKTAGIAPKDLQTSGLSLNPNVDYGRSGTDPAKIDGYTASSTVTVRVRALDALGTTLDAAVKDGVNTLNGISFGLIDPAPQTDEARRRAVADARHRAELYAEAAGVTLGAILDISEDGAASPRPMFRMADSAVGATPVEAGEIDLGASVTIVWAVAQ